LVGGWFSKPSVICFLVQHCSYCTFLCLQIPHTVGFVSCHTSYNALVITNL
jgi:hypothetical protein